MNDDPKDSHGTAMEIIDGLIIGFAGWMVILVIILIAFILSEGRDEFSSKGEKPQVCTTMKLQ